MSIYLGIDTSNYTTSVACVGDVFINERKIIDIKEGMRGIRQSDGVFVHLKELPQLFERLSIDMKSVSAVGVSTRPRNVEGSYMPVFLAGESFAKVIAKSLNVPLFEYSHQDGHIMAGILSQNAEELLDEPFLAVHLSGGTTEILECEYKENHFSAKIVGGTKDISAGQLIDRLGVALGMKFPCGKEIDKLSLSCDKEPINLKTSVKDGYINFSGVETKLLSMQGTEDAGLLAKTALAVIGKSLTCAINFQKPKRVLFVGGVASNIQLREYFEKEIDAKTYFASKELSCDNAVGIAELCRRANI
ncbi:MAG: hypothetical protein IJ304_06315 [Clostridia bacterium]|nr:hypothetical protein [Clostridia bacterium]